MTGVDIYIYIFFNTEWLAIAYVELKIDVLWVYQTFCYGKRFQKWRKKNAVVVTKLFG